MRSHPRPYRPTSLSRRKRNQHRNPKQVSQNRRYVTRLQLYKPPNRDLRLINILLILAGVIYYLLNLGN